jgi:hypothetical protein
VTEATVPTFLPDLTRLRRRWRALTGRRPLRSSRHRHRQQQQQQRQRHPRRSLRPCPHPRPRQHSRRRSWATQPQPLPLSPQQPLRLLPPQGRLCCSTQQVRAGARGAHAAHRPLVPGCRLRQRKEVSASARSTRTPCLGHAMPTAASRPSPCRSTTRISPTQPAASQPRAGPMDEAEPSWVDPASELAAARLRSELGAVDFTLCRTQLLAY